jgi:hypothetical protein
VRSNRASGKHSGWPTPALHRATKSRVALPRRASVLEPPRAFPTQPLHPEVARTPRGPEVRAAHLPALWNVTPPYVLPALCRTDAALSSSPCPRCPSPVLLLALHLFRRRCLHRSAQPPPRGLPCGLPTPRPAAAVNSHPRLTTCQCEPSSTSPSTHTSCRAAPTVAPGPNLAGTAATTAAPPWPLVRRSPATTTHQPSAQLGP